MKLALSIEGDASIIAMVVAYIATLPIAPGAAPSLTMPIPPMPALGGGGEDGDEGEDGPVNANAPAVDSTGLPWDERIHAKTKTMAAGDVWTKKRGGPKGDELAAIEAQLRASVPQPQPMPMPAIQPAPVPQPMPMPAPIPAPVAQPTPMPMPAPAPIPMPAPEPAPAPVMAAPAQAAVAATVAQATGTLDFAQFMQHLSGQMQKRDAAGAPLVHADYLASIVQEISTAFAPHGFAALSAITDIANNPQMITYAAQLMQRDGRW